MLCDPIPEPNYKREILKSLALGDEPQTTLDIAWAMFCLGRWSKIDYPGVIFEEAFVKSLSDESGVPEEQIHTYYNTPEGEQECNQNSQKSVSAKLKDFVTRNLRLLFKR